MKQITSRVDPRPRIIIRQPDSSSSCFAVIPRGPRIRPTKLYYENEAIRWIVTLKFEI